jgi:hypothetical protein
MYTHHKPILPPYLKELLGAMFQVIIVIHYERHKHLLKVSDMAERKGEHSKLYMKISEIINSRTANLHPQELVGIVHNITGW